MKIVWDEPKRLRNLTERRMDFASLTVKFFEASVIYPTRDSRFMAIGEHEGRILAVVFRPLGSEALSVISMRPASRKERNR